jgi:hypothetical protein
VQRKKTHVASQQLRIRMALRLTKLGAGGGEDGKGVPPKAWRRNARHP